MKVKFLKGPYAEQVFEFNSPCITIGRDGGNQLILDTDGVSRCHAELKQNSEGVWQIADLNSTNGVKINGTRINSSAPVSDGDVLTIGENKMEISQLSQEPARVIFNPIISAPPEELHTKVEGSLLPGGAQNVSDVKLSVSVQAANNSSSTPEPEKNSDTMGGSVDIKALSGSLFGRKGAAKGADSGEKAGAAGETDSRKRRSNLIFYTVLVCVVIMILSFLFSVLNPSKPRKNSRSRELPVAIRYEKEIFSKDNVFRFELNLKSAVVKVKTPAGKDGKTGSTYKREYSIIFTIDDIASSRHFSREVPLSDDSVNELRQVISSSGIFSVTDQARSGESNVHRRLTIVNGSAIQSLNVAGEFAPSEFNAVEDELIRITEAFGLKTIAMTPAELIAMAEKSYTLAEDYYANRRAGAANLRDAVRHYQVTVESLEQFSPKPPLWEKARVKLAEAVKERDMALDALETEYRRLAQQRSFESMKQVFRQIMELTDPESREHSSARRRLIYIEQILRKKKR